MSAPNTDSPYTNKTPTATVDKKALIFLDIDGVLLPFPKSSQSTSGAIFPDDTLYALSEIMTAVPEADLVLSSTWRAQDNLINEIVDSLFIYGKAHGGPLRNFKEFSYRTDPNYHSERQHEIGAYLIEQQQDEYRNNRYVAWVALDDEELLEGTANEKHRSMFEGHVVKTNSRIGLTNNDAIKAIQLLRQQLRLHQ